MTHVPLNTTSVQEQLEGCSRSVNNFAHGFIDETPDGMTKKITDPPAPMVTQAADIYLTAEGRCNYISEQGMACDTEITEHKYLSRHWFSNHAMKELEDIERGKLTMERALIVTTQAKIQIANKYRIYCWFKKCRHIRSKKFFVRHDSIVRHLRKCAKANNVSMSKDEANAWAHNRMELERQPRASIKWANRWEAAIWRIHHAS